MQFQSGLVMSLVVLIGGCSGAYPEDESGQAPASAVGEVHERISTVVDIGSPGHDMKYFDCAALGGTCDVGLTPHFVAMGPRGGGNALNYSFALIGGRFACDRSLFAGGPIALFPDCFVSPYVAVLNSHNQPLTENNFSGSPVVGNIAYGSDGVYNFKTFTSPTFVNCSNAQFGNPNNTTTVKGCFQVSREYQYYAPENSILQAFALPVAYCGDGACNFQIVSGANLSCGNSVFGDPRPGVVKSCYLFGLPRLIATEGQSFNTGQLQGVGVDVAYGSGANGIWLHSNSAAGPCNNTLFGDDPDVGTQKRCYTSN
jgi:hypothetical protein